MAVGWDGSGFGPSPWVVDLHRVGPGQKVQNMAHGLSCLD